MDNKDTAQPFVGTLTKSGSSPTAMAEKVVKFFSENSIDEMKESVEKLKYIMENCTISNFINIEEENKDGKWNRIKGIWR